MCAGAISSCLPRRHGAGPVKRTTFADLTNVLTSNEIGEFAIRMTSTPTDVAMAGTPKLMERADRDIAAFIEEAETKPSTVNPILFVCTHTHVHKCP